MRYAFSKRHYFNAVSFLRCFLEGFEAISIRVYFTAIDFLASPLLVFKRYCDFY